MNAVFADTAYWIALTNVQDVDHKKAEAYSASLRPRPVIPTETVLIGVTDVLTGDRHFEQEGFRAVFRST